VVSLRCRSQLIELTVRVAHTGPQHCGLEFRCDSNQDQSAIARLVISLKDQRNRHLLILVPKLGDSLSVSKARC
jgi:hypothetical protein